MFSIIVLLWSIFIGPFVSEANYYHPSYNPKRSSEVKRMLPRRPYWPKQFDPSSHSPPYLIRPALPMKGQERKEYFKRYATQLGGVLENVFPRTNFTLPDRRLNLGFSLETGLKRNLNLTNDRIESKIKLNLKTFHSTPIKSLKIVKARVEYQVPRISFSFKFNYNTNVTCANGRMNFIVFNVTLVVYFTANQTKGCGGEHPVEVRGFSVVKEDEIFQSSRIQFSQMRINLACERITQFALGELFVNKTRDFKTIENSVKDYFTGHSAYPAAVNENLVSKTCKPYCEEQIDDSEMCHSCKGKFCNRLLDLLS